MYRAFAAIMKSGNPIRRNAEPADDSERIGETIVMFEVLEGKNIRLRKAREEDWQSMLKHVWSDEAVYRWMLYQPTLTEEDAVERCHRSMQFQKDHG